MTATVEKPAEQDNRSNLPYIIGRWVVIAIIAILSLQVLNFARERLVAPFDGLITEQMCLRYGEDTGRTLLDFERSNRFTLGERSDGFCSYGPGLNGEPALSLTVQETEPGALYTWAKVVGILLQLGVVSTFIRLVTEPALETYRFIAERLGFGPKR